jgi:hypothetical protein
LKAAAWTWKIFDDLIPARSFGQRKIAGEN